MKVTEKELKKQFERELKKTSFDEWQIRLIIATFDVTVLKIELNKY